MARCLRCGAGAEWIAGPVRVEPSDLDEGFARALQIAWRRYQALFGEPPHGTLKQVRAMLELLPKNRRRR